MDADTEERQRNIISRRWSMNSQRVEQIVAELMRPIGDLRRSFDTDLSALLEEYLTEAGLHALEEDGASPVVPNFAELALLLQQSANIYGRKVDLLYQHVLECSESLHNNTETHTRASSSTTNSPSTPHGSRRKRRYSTLGWARIALEPSACARREPELRPPPTLPRMYVELEPRVLADCDAPSYDYGGEPVGLLQDFNVTWRLHEGLLVDELESGEEQQSAAVLRSVPLSELQAAIEAAAPPSPPPAWPEPEDEPLPPSSTPTPAEEPPPPPSLSPVVAEAEAALARSRKRKQPPTEPGRFCDGAGKILLTPELRVFLREQRDFSLSDEWVSRVVAVRCAKVLAGRARLRKEPEIKEFRGFEEVDRSDLVDIGGFLGWNATEVELEATDVSRCLSRLLSAAESDDDGFFEQSSLGSEGSRAAQTPPRVTPPPPEPPLPLPVDYLAQPEWMSWRAGIVARASAGEAKGMDVHALGAAVLDALPAPTAAGDKGPPTPFNGVLGTVAKDDADVSRVFLATLFLVNAGNVEVIQGPPLSLSSFSLQLVSRDERLYSAAADADPAFLR